MFWVILIVGLILFLLPFVIWMIENILKHMFGGTVLEIFTKFNWYYRIPTILIGIILVFVSFFAL